MQLIKLQCKDVTYVLKNSEGEYSKCLSDAEVDLFSSGSCSKSVLTPYVFSPVVPTCPIMQISTVLTNENENKTEDPSSSAFAPVDTEAKEDKEPILHKVNTRNKKAV